MNLIKSLLLGLLIIGCQKQLVVNPELNGSGGGVDLDNKEIPKKPANPDLNLITKEPNLTLKSNKGEMTKKSFDLLKVDFIRSVGVLGVVGENTLMAADKLRKLDSESQEPIYVIIDSPGGSVLDGAQFITAMQTIDSEVITVCVRFCASMAFIIHQYGSKRYMLSKAVLMSHFASTSANGDVDKITTYINFVQKFVDSFSSDIAKRAGMSTETYINLISKDLWMDDVQALDMKFSDGTVNVKF